jgi:orotate phosphoribosyltransferase
MLFETTAFRIAKADEPFWYTSGALGPMYINTHFLYGSEEKANSLLEIIDKNKNDYENCPFVILNLVKKNYKEDKIFKSIIDIVIEYINKNIDINSFDYISGGERRDWFFSLITADILNKKHITIYKNKKIVITSDDKIIKEDLKDKKVFHIADLMNEASSYINAWIPAIRENGAKIIKSLVIINRKQGGDKLVLKENVEPHSIIDVEDDFMNDIYKLGLIDKNQSEILLNYMKNPKKTMEEFLKNNKEFIDSALKSSDEKTRARAEKCIENKIYKF